MEKRAEQFDVSTTQDGKIKISQDNFGNDEPDMVIIMPEQTDLLVQWLQEARTAVTAARQVRAENGHRGRV